VAAGAGTIEGIRIDAEETEAPLPETAGTDVCGVESKGQTKMVDRITEVVARAWIECDPNRSDVNPDALINVGPPSDMNGQPNWHWFIPRAEALRDYLSDNGLVIRPK
jgi:hypothetical protein